MRIGDDRDNTITMDMFRLDKLNAGDGGDGTDTLLISEDFLHSHGNGIQVGGTANAASRLYYA